MIANCAFAAALTVLLTTIWLARELTFLAPYKALIFREYTHFVVGGLLLFFLNLLGAFYVTARWLFVRETGQKLSHLDRQLTTPDAVLKELREINARRSDDGV
jgi:hypothetical protein